MAVWVQYLIALAALLALAPLVARFGRRFGSKAKGGLALACFMLGFGEALDPPAKHAIEAADRVKGSPETGAPPL